ncbi:replication protein [Virgibacillus sp. Bac330]|uniref:replication protein n=1 Tax=Virgibacillus sp. Bac330 TaxID=2419841 RepID=UPI0013CE7AFD|nr:replication protein [Virgibacillus sp. Bac330]
MASPQTEKGHVRIANELWNELLRRDFSKRQQNLILFIWRLSYGTGQKDCVIDKFNNLELAGMYKQDVKKELKFLRECAVLDWDEKTMVFSINKNYHLWQITPNKNWDSEKFDELIHQNLSRKKVSKTRTKKENEVSETLTKKKSRVSKTLTFKSKQVSKILTMRLVKYLPTPDRKSIVPTDTDSLKTLLKTLKIKDIKIYTTADNSREDTLTEHEQDKKVTDAIVYYQNNFGMIRPALADEMLVWINDFGDEMVIEAMQRSLDRNKPSWGYARSILQSWSNKGIKTMEQVQAEDIEFQSQKMAKHQRYSKPQTQAPGAPVPEWFRQQKQQQKAQKDSQSSNIGDANEQKELEQLLKQYSSG